MIRNIKNSWWTLDQVSILHEKNKNLAVLSYDCNANAWRSRSVTGVAYAVSNCYVRISFDSHVFNDILCTPSQAFYLPRNKEWMCAYQIKEGDLLLAKDNQTVAVARIKFIQKSLPVISIEVADMHTFCVGNYNIVTHNMLVPDMAINTIPIFSAAGVGASISILSNPITATIVGGVIACGVIGYIVKSWANKKTIYYELNYDANKIGIYCNDGSDAVDSKSKATSGIVFGGTPDPEDPKKNKKERAKNKTFKKDFFKKIDSDYEPYKRGIYKKKVNRGLFGKKVQFLEWDYLHNDVEAYDKRGLHLGSIDPQTLKFYKPPVPFRTVFN